MLKDHLPDQPGEPFQLPQSWIAQLTASAQAGARAGLVAPAPFGGSARRFIDWTVRTFPGIDMSITAQELQYMRQLAQNRTPSLTQTANWFAGDGDKQIWDRELARWQKSVGPRQAAWGAKLLNTALLVNKEISDASKKRFGRPRPYEADPSLTLAVPQPGKGSASYPSGHAARAFMEASILSQLMPERRDEFMKVAQQMAMSRVYGGVHYPSDTVGGAYEGALVASWLFKNMPRPVG